MFGKNIIKNYQERTILNEDEPVLDFLTSLPTTNGYEFLEVGSGLGRFVLLLANIKKHLLNITCLEINKTLANDLSSKGFNVIQGSILDSPFDENKFDVVHCSHVIEHFGYPDVIKLLDYLIKITKTGGYIIIRSPLMHPGFYNDIDHIRPYPPQTIMNYFNNPQQQQKGSASVKLLSNWTRRETAEIYANFPGIWYINLLLKFFWTKFGWPRGKANGYVAIFKKES